MLLLILALTTARAVDLPTTGEAAAWLEAHACPDTQPAWREALAAHLDHGALGSLLARHPVVHTEATPDGHMDVVGGPPWVAMEYRGDCLARVRPTVCGPCPVGVRMASDLIDTSRSRPVLLPGRDLAVRAWADAHRQGPHWWAALHDRGVHQGRALLEGAQVTAGEGARATVAWPDGHQEEWTAVWEGGEWRLDYASLPEDSVVRMDRTEERSWHTPDYRRRQARAAWRPDLEARDGGIRVGTRAVGAGYHPLDGQVWVAALDVDRETTGLFWVDPGTGQVTSRAPLPMSSEVQLPLNGWFGRWPTAATPAADLLAWSSPGRVTVSDTRSGQRTRHVSARARALAWDGEALLVATAAAVTRHEPDGPRWIAPAHLPVGVFPHQGQVWVALASGEVLGLDGATGELLASREACCEAGATDAALRPSGSEILVGCAAPCPAVAERVDLLGTERWPLEGLGSATRGSSWSPDGAWLTTGAPGALLLWRASGDAPAAVLPEAVHVAWAPDASSLLRVDPHGDVWLHPVPPEQ